MNRWWLLLMICMVWLGIGGCQKVNPPLSASHQPTELLTENLIGHKVVTSDEILFGLVDGIVVGTENAEAIYVVVRIEDIYNFGKGISGPQDRFLLIPWARLQIDTPHQRLTVDMTAEELNQAPTAYDLPEPSIPLWDEEVRQFWRSN